MTFVARTDELEYIEHAAASPAETATVFTGELGMGKSRLLEVAHNRLRAQSVLLRANPAEAAWPLSGFSTIFASIDDSRAVEFSGRFTLRSTEPQFMFAAARDLLSLLRGLNLDPLMVFIDDLDRMDAESQTLIGFMAGRLAGTGLRFVASAAPLTPDSPLAGFAQREIPRFGIEESAELLSSELGAGADAGTLRILASQGDGNPLVMIDAARSLSHEQAAGLEPLVLPARPHDALKAAAAERLSTVPENQRRLLQSIALAPIMPLSALLGGPDDADALEEILYAGLAVARGQSVRLDEPLLRSSLYWEMRPRLRRERHLELALAVGEADPRLCVWHQSFDVAGEPFTDPLLDAAIGFVADGDPATAVELADRALLLAADLTGHHDGVLRLVRALTAQAELDLAARYLKFVRFPPASASLNMALAAERITIDFERSQSITPGEVDAAVSLYGDDDPAGAVTLLSRAAFFRSSRWELDEARRGHALGARFAPRTGASTIFAHDEAGALLDAIEGVPDPGLSTDRLSADDLQRLSVYSLVTFGETLSYRERYGQARRVYTIIFRRHSHHRLANEWARQMAYINEMRAQDFHRARIAVEEWMAEPVESVINRSTRALALYWYSSSGDRSDDAVGYAKDCLARASAEHHSAVLAMLFTLQGADALLAREPEEAVRLLQQADVATGGAGPRNPAMIRHSADLVEALMTAGRPRDAEGVLRRLEDQLVRRPTQWLDLAVARSRALVAPDDLAGALFEEAVRRAPTDSLGYDRGRTLLAQGEWLARQGDAKAADRAIADAVTAFERSGAVRWARRTDAPDVPRAPAEASAVLAMLTAEEREVAQMVSRGFRNREIASELYLSLRTVELRLTHIYRKVGARSRSHLASLLN